MELVALKRRQPGEDITSWLIQHPAGLRDEELKDQLVMLMGAGVEPERNLIANALLLMLAGDQPGAPERRGSGMSSRTRWTTSCGTTRRSPTTRRTTRCGTSSWTG
ncbi:hypothetical protein SMICM304S_03295 [Streptomyces microflavus]